MKKINFQDLLKHSKSINQSIIFTICLISMISILFSCNDDETPAPAAPVAKEADYSSNTSKQRVALAETLIKAFGKSPEALQTTIAECQKRADGDTEVLCSELFYKKVSSPTARGVDMDFGQLIDQVYDGVPINPDPIASQTTGFTDMLIETDSIVQVAMYVAEEVADSTSIKGIVVVPENFDEKSGENLLLIKKDGTKTTISSVEEPFDNYLVISTNERSSPEWREAIANMNRNKTNKEDESIDTRSGRTLIINRAMFANYDAMRRVEPWFMFGPEVILNVIYYYPTNGREEYSPRQRIYGSWSYKKWVWRGFRSGLRTYVKWNEINKTINGSWDVFKPAYVTLIWTEEDATPLSSELNTPIKFTNPYNGSEYTATVVQYSNQQTICEGTIYLNSLQGEYSWNNFLIQPSVQ